MPAGTMRAGAEPLGTEAKVAFLSAPEAYRERPARVEVVETHMSWVFLTDSHAYKLKKPVRYDFLDFGTVEARRRNCEEEIRLNQPLARGTYLVTVPLTVDRDRGLRLGGKGEAVDWLVKSRRLPAEATLAHAITAGAIREADLRRAAEMLAEFYREAPPIEIEPAAYRKRFEVAIQANRRELALTEHGLPRDAVDRVAAAQLEYLARRSDVLDERVRRKRIIEGHGDLRPQHIYLKPEPLIIDRLEFNREFRILDPADELSYLAMECELLGAPVVGELCFGAYTRITRDAPAENLLLFYKSCRAALRAKIAVWHTREPRELGPVAWVDRARKYLDLAAGYARRLG